MSIQLNRQSKISAAVSAALPVFVFASVLTGGSSAFAVTQLYDANTAAPANDGAGVWDTTTANWNNAANNAASDTTWSNTTADTAIFGASTTGLSASATVVVGTVNVGTIQFNQVSTATTSIPGYTLSAGTITLGSGITNAGATGTTTISAKITGTNGLAFTGVSGSSVQVSLNGANDYTGVTSLSTGGRLAGGSSGLGSSAGASATTLGLDYTLVNAGATLVAANVTWNEALILNGSGSASAGALRVNNTNTLNSLIQLGSASTIQFNGSSGNTFNGNIAMGANLLTVNGGSTTVANTFNGVISGSAGLTFGNNGQVDFLTNANTYSGITNNGANSLGIGNNTALGTSTLNFAGGGVESTDGTTRTLSNAVTFNASTGAVFGTITGQVAPVGTGALKFTSVTPMDLGTTGHALVTNTDVTFAAGFTGTGSITKTGASTLTLDGSGTGTNTVGLTVNAGTLAGVGSVGAATVAAAATFAPGDAGIGTFNVASATVPGTLAIQYDGSTLASSDSVNATGNLNITNGILSLANLSATAPTNGVYVLANYLSLTGTFASVTGLPSGYGIDYAYNNGTSIALTPTPEPAALGLLAVVSGLGLTRRRKAC